MLISVAFELPACVNSVGFLWYTSGWVFCMIRGNADSAMWLMEQAHICYGSDIPSWEFCPGPWLALFLGLISSWGPGHCHLFSCWTSPPPTPDRSLCWLRQILIQKACAGGLPGMAEVGWRE
jgi:hypothetical protein